EVDRFFADVDVLLTGHLEEHVAAEPRLSLPDAVELHFHALEIVRARVILGGTHDPALDVVAQAFGELELPGGDVEMHEPPVRYSRMVRTTSIVSSMGVASGSTGGSTSSRVTVSPWARALPFSSSDLRRSRSSSSACFGSTRKSSATQIGRAHV